MLFLFTTEIMFRADPKEISTGTFHSYMLGAIGPRPIAFASTMDKEGTPNLSPFSFFNAFGSKPPLLIFSPARRVRNNTIKHTLENVLEVPEAVINVVSYNMAQQTSLASTEYPRGTNEFIKSGLTPLPSELVRPFRVKESPVQMECKVLEVKETGREGGAANLIICEILLMHIHESVLTPENKIDVQKIDLIARMGGDWYCRAHGNALFELPQPRTTLGIGVDRIPEEIRLSRVLTGNDLGKLGSVEALPSEEEVAGYRKGEFMKDLFSKFGDNPNTFNIKIHQLAHDLLEQGEVMEAWKMLLSY